MSPEDLSRALVEPGRASIPYRDHYSADRPLVLECFRPRGHSPDKPVVIVQHGMSRNGAEYCEAWVPAAERHGLLIVAITFPMKPGRTLSLTTMVMCSPRTAAFGRASAGHRRSPGASLRCCVKQA